ncbi:MAG: glycoside hydrolase family 5 protein [Oscillospiraceae bacterium]|nr:glycoside hydrolase family 5 protein [Oscillospiraceae bacterium]
MIKIKKIAAMKKIAMAALAAAMCISCLAGCKDSNSDDAVTPEDTQAEVTEALYEMTPMRDIPSIELVKEMRVGWNLGNTFDSLIENPDGNETAEQWETAWGQPVTTQRLIDSVKAQGFNVLRLPVTWEGKFGEAPDYTIREDWLARVKEVVDYAYANDMFVILNAHHEEWNNPTADNEAAADEILRAIWKQIAEYFKDYNEKLIFEGMNEPRLKGTPMEWTGGNAEAREVINHWNAAFVETVRATGGNNANRHLMVPTYAASTSGQVLNETVIPDDDKVILSVHAYLPYNFALAGPESAVSEWSSDNAGDTRDIDVLFADLKDRYIDKGQAVIMGEFGSRNRMNTAARADCARYYITKATEAGVPCVWWDNNAFVGNGENFGLIDRKSYEWRYPEIITAMMEARGGEWD